MPEYFEDEFVIKSRDGKRSFRFDISKLTNLNANYVSIPSKRDSEEATKLDIINQLDVKTIDYDTTGGELGGVLGRLKWNNADMTLDLGVSDGSVTLQLGQELHTPCRNFTGSTIPDFRVVRTTGQQGNRVTVEMAQANSLANCETTYGITTQELVNNQIGMVTSYGLINNVNTEAFTEGAVLYLSDTTAGMLTMTPPITPSFRIPMAICVRSHQSNGKVLVSIHPSRSLNTLTGDTLISNPTNGQVLKYDGTKWVNGTGGGGDMFQSVYDTNGDGRVNIAEGLQTSGDPDLYTSTLVTQKFNNRAILDGNNTYTNSTNFYNFPSSITLSGGAAIDLTGGNIITGAGDISPTELAQLDGINTASTIQTQLNSKASLTANNTYSGTNTFNNNIIAGVNSVVDLRVIEHILVGGGAGTQIDGTEISYLNGVTSNIQTQFGTKAGLTSTNNWTTGTNTFNASTILSILTLLKFARTSLTSSTTLGTNGNFFSLDTGAVTTTLPTGNDGRLVILFNNSATNKGIFGHINNVASTTITLTALYDFAILISNNSTWVKLICKIGGVISA